MSDDFYRKIGNKFDELKAVTSTIFVIHFLLHLILNLINKQSVLEAVYVAILYLIPLILMVLISKKKKRVLSLSENDGAYETVNEYVIIKGYYAYYGFGSIIIYLILSLLVLTANYFQDIIGAIWIDLFKYIALSVIFILSIYIVKIFIKILIPNDNKKYLLNKLAGKVDVKKFIQTNPQYSLAFFLSIFLSITYLFSLSIAFEDKANNNTSLFCTTNGYYNVDSIKVVQEEKLGRFLFPSGSSTIFYNKKNLDDIYQDNSKYETTDQICDTNKAIIDKLSKSLRVKSKQKKYRNIKITLKGKTDSEKLDKTLAIYSSNYNLAESRALQVRELISDSIKAIRKDLNEIFHVEWTIVPLIDDSNYLGNKLNSNPKLDDRCVIVAIDEAPNHAEEIERNNQLASSNDFNLLDYHYFLIYTITTTGYGDILPVSIFSKFIVSIANIYEVFFLVVFLNIFMSYLREDIKTASHTSDGNELTSEQ